MNRGGFFMDTSENSSFSPPGRDNYLRFSPTGNLYPKGGVYKKNYVFVIQEIITTQELIV